jgi:hypothetical protein
MAKLRSDLAVDFKEAIAWVLSQLASQSNPIIKLRGLWFLAQVARNKKTFDK